METVSMFFGASEIIGWIIVLGVIAVVSLIIWGQVSKEKGKEVGEGLQDFKSFGEGMREGLSGESSSSNSSGNETEEKVRDIVREEIEKAEANEKE